MDLFWPQKQKDWKEVITSLNQTSVLKPFDSEALSFFQSLSKFMMKDIQFRQYPELIALAYWMRKSNIIGMKDAFEKEKQERYLRARGTVLQFAPSNVDTIFIYSWVLSLLAGNRSVIRISRKQSEQTKLLIYALEHCLYFPENKEIAKKIVIVSYDHNDEITQFLSENCHVRVIWGGDSTVKAIRSVSLASLATEVVFPDRFSLSMFKASKILSLEDHEMKEFIHHFYNDSFWFGQMACSSPRLVVWEGSQPCIQEAQNRFWSQFDKYIVDHYRDYASATQVQKLATSYFYGIEKEVTEVDYKPTFSRIEINRLTDQMREEHCGGGLFLEWKTDSILDLPSIIHDKDQTLAYFGFETEELIQLVDMLQNRGIDRIVPVGQALNFEEVWDGYRLLTYFTREIVVK